MLQRQALSQRDTIMISFGVIQNQFFRCFLQGEPQTLPFSGSRTGDLEGFRMDIEMWCNSTQPDRGAGDTKSSVESTNDLG